MREEDDIETRMGTGRQRDGLRVYEEKRKRPRDEKTDEEKTDRGRVSNTEREEKRCDMAAVQ